MRGNSENETTEKLHFFIIWEHGRHKEKEILADIGERCEILECFDIRWSPNRVINNFCRLDGLDWWAGRQQAKKRGTGRFLLITVRDDNPVYELAEAFHGFEWTNINVLELTKRFSERNTRKNTEIVYSSIVSEEANRYLTLILGKNPTDYLASVKTPWDGSIVKMDQDILGANGWNSLEEAFYVLNNTINYVVLRDFEELPHRFDAATQDIDILTDEPERLLCILNPPLRYGLFRQRGQVKVNVGGQQILWDIRHTGDDYYCLQWEQEMLQDKVLSPENVYVLNDEHHFYSLVYHALVHRTSIPKDYYAKAERLLEALFEAGIISTNTDERWMFPQAFDYYFDLLNDYMKRQRYVFCQPKRGKYNHHVVRLPQITERLKNKFKLNKIKPVHIHWHAPVNLFYISGCDPTKKYRHFFIAERNGKKIFIKQSDFIDDRLEFNLMRRFHSVNKDNSLEPLFYSDVVPYACIATGFVDGERLIDRLKRGDISQAERANLVFQIKTIAEGLREAEVLHRDAGAYNFIVAEDGSLKLLDFGSSCDGKKLIISFFLFLFSESLCAVRRKSLFFRHVCNKCKHNRNCRDEHFLLKTLEKIGCEENYRDVYRETETLLKEIPEIMIVCCRYRGCLMPHRIRVAFCRFVFERWIKRT